MYIVVQICFSIYIFNVVVFPNHSGWPVGNLLLKVEIISDFRCKGIAKISILQIILGKNDTFTYNYVFFHLFSVRFSTFLFTLKQNRLFY